MIAATPQFSRADVERVVRDILQQRLPSAGNNGKPNPLVVNISARHIHLTDEHVQTLFGNPDPEPMTDLSQYGSSAP